MAEKSGFMLGYGQRLRPAAMEPSQSMLLRGAVTELLDGGKAGIFRSSTGMSASTSGCTAALAGNAVLLIADDGKSFENEPSTPAVLKAHGLIERAGCQLKFVPSRGVVWRSTSAAFPERQEAP
jgi:hypothetical protein